MVDGGSQWGQCEVDWRRISKQWNCGGEKKNNGIVIQVAELKGKQWLFIITDNKKFPENLVEK